ALEEALYLEIVVCADDAAPRHGGQCFDEAQDVRLGESRENSEMEQRGTKAAARQREADLPAVAREGGLGVVAQKGGEGLPGGRPGVPRRAFTRHPHLLEPGEAHQLLEGALLFPLRRQVLASVREPSAGLGIVSRPEVEFGPRDGVPVAAGRYRGGA